MIKTGLFVKKNWQMSFFYIKEELMQGGLHGKIVLFFAVDKLRIYDIGQSV